MIDYAEARRMMVECQVRTFDVTDLAVLAALDVVPRERFVPPEREALAYSDQPIRIDSAVAGSGRVLLAPMVLARLIQGFGLAPNEQVLDVGCGTGYSSVVLARIGAHVTALEPDPELAAQARDIIASLGETGINVVEGLASRGFAPASPYAAILVNGAFEVQPDGLLTQLKDSGRLAGIEGGGLASKAVLLRRSGRATSRHVLFDATAPVFHDLRKTPEFIW
jgi:protein-L-isoaspartate(D-aspartate) O-methyltransferase